MHLNSCSATVSDLGSDVLPRLKLIALDEHSHKRKEAYTHIEPNIKEIADAAGERAQLIVEENGYAVHVHTTTGERKPSFIVGFDVVSRSRSSNSKRSPLPSTQASSSIGIQKSHHLTLHSYPNTVPRVNSRHHSDIYGAAAPTADMTFVDALTTAILPVLSIAAVGFLLGRAVDVEVRPLAVVTVYVLAPALVFDSMVTTELAGSQIGTLAVGVGVVTVVMAVVGEAAAWLDGTDGSARNGLVLASTFSNCGNFGIPLSAFAFGAVGRSTAVLYLVAQNLLMYTLGVYLAARGGERSTLSGITEVVRLPLVYALAAGLLGRHFGVVPSADSAAMEMVSLTGNAAIPVMLLLLGLQLARADYGATVRRMALPNVLRLAVAPVVATGVALAVGFADPTVARVFVLESSMPVAITPLILAIEYDRTDADVSAPAYLGTAIFTSTVLSIPTMAILITVLRSGAIV